MAHPEPLADKLYSETKQFLENHVQHILATQVSPPNTQNITNSSTGDNADNLLQRYYVAWSKYSQGVEYLHQLYSYVFAH